jgi:hypothetical protein
MTTAQIIRLVIIAMVFVVPVIIRMIKAASDAKERRRLEQLRQYQINEAMRTGRPVEQVLAQPFPTPPPAASPNQAAQERLREMAARRQAQIDALRRQRAQGGASGPVATGPTNAYQNQPNASPYPVVRQQTGRAAPQARPPQPQAQQRQQQPRGPSKAQRKQQAIDAQRARDADAWHRPTNEIGGGIHDHEGDVTHRLVPDATDGDAPRVAARTVPGVARPRVALGDLRQAVILREVLGRPLAIRDDRDAA